MASLLPLLKAACAVSLLVPALVRGQETSGADRALHAVRTQALPTIDGSLDDAVWQLAPPQRGFVQTAPRPGEPATEQTEVRILYDQGSLFVGVRLHDQRPDSVFSRLTRRDDTQSLSDRVAVFIDGYHDRRTAMMFEATPRGSQSDVLWFSDNSEDAAWDAVWEVATRVDSLGWTAEFRIPLAQLRYLPDPDGETIMGLQVRRYLARRDEVSYWAPHEADLGRTVSQFGRLHGLEGLASPRRFELSPYVVSKVTRAPGSPLDPFWSQTSNGWGVGADMKLGLTQNLTLTTTVLPDFGQVEADPAQVNLTAFEQSYPEKRPFFTEGSEAFRFPTLVPEGSAFYSRRIGRQPQRPTSAPQGGWVDNPETTRVLGAAKLVGRTSSGWSVGALSALTGEESSESADSLGVRSRVVAEPMTHYGLARISRNLRGGASGIGALLTSTHRQLGDDPRLLLLRSSAWSGGLDGRHRFAGGLYEATGWVLASSIHGDTAAIAAAQRGAAHRFQRSDATHLTYDPTLRSMQGWSGELGLTKRVTDGLGWRLQSGARSPGVDINDAGFLSFTDVLYLFSSLTYRRNRPGQYLRNWNVAGNFVPVWSWGGELQQAEMEVTWAAQFLSGWAANGNIVRRPTALDVAALRGGPALRYVGNTSGSVTVTSDGRRPLSARFQVNARRDDVEGGYNLNVQPTLDFRPSGSTTTSLAFRYNWQRSPDQYIRTVTVAGTPRFIVASIEQRTAALTARVSQTVTPTLSLDIYAQPFLSSGDYQAIRRVRDPAAADFGERFDTFGPERLSWDAATSRYAIDEDGNGQSDFFLANPDFTIRQWRSTAVVRWEYRPGSTLYLVWTQAQNASDRSPRLELGRDLDRLFASDGTHVLMLKASYWIGR